MDTLRTGTEQRVTEPAGLRDVTHPDLSSVLVHFVDRNRPAGIGVPDEIRALDPVERMESILTDGAISAFVTYSGGMPSVCMTEATWVGVSYLVESRGYKPWALMFDRQKVYDAGGGPVWYARPDEYKALKDNTRLRTWAVELSDQSDWSHEREWRVPRPADSGGIAPSIPLLELGFCGVLVGDAAWDPRTVAHDPNLGVGNLPTHWDFLPSPALVGIPRYWWNSAESSIVRL
ncbi:hypothetical protein [Nocardia cyriacigeorgica]|uniref:hypothetical protein n=1 Tax=Nocardia cyriacigeorgica TaxID=135487 RepID=UPI0018936B8F|nr:hypothetical protein [Nocardia cyriacigeorgica]MBF6456440.1 hypothetical protein [Nocardia cyriacigeorgica]MBF6479384.1 hypothetical protein [Nocardia cyriacigeorgica]MBF6551246.1 hypothetical protein [Nocardia cyriacigeorgica]